MRTAFPSLTIAVTLLATRAGALPRFSDWSAPVNLGALVNSPADDFGPAVSKDGLSLYFSSTRPGGFGGEDVWVSRRNSLDDRWGPPENLGPPVNTGANERQPSFSRDGHWMFFASNAAGGFGGFDVWVSYREHVHDDFGWQAPMNLGAGVNTASADAGTTYFENAGILQLYLARGATVATTDLYVSTLNPDGSFGPAVLVPELSSPGADGGPKLRHDGLEMFIHSTRPGSAEFDLWVSTRDTTLDAWSPPVHLGTAVNSPFRERDPAILSDRATLLFASNRSGGVGGLDLYMTTRVKLGRRQ